MIDEILDDQPKIPKPQSPKLDPRSGLSFAQQQALHIDHGPPLPPEPEPYSAGMMDHGIGIPPIPGNPFLPPNDFEQTPSDFSYSTNHSDQGYLSGTSGSNLQRDSFGRNQFHNSNQFVSNFGGGNQSGHFDYGNRSQIPPPQSPFVKPGGYGNTPMSYDSGMSQQTPSTPQTPQPLMQNEVQERTYDSRDRGGRNRDKRDRDYGNNTKFQESERNRNKNSEWNRDRDRFNRDSRDRDKGRRDWKYERDNEYNRRERDRDRNRNLDRERRRNDFREARKDERENSREKIVEKEIPKEEPFIPTPPPPTFTPKPSEPKEEDEPRSMSLESRIQSLLSGFRSPEPAKPPPKEETPPPIIHKSSKPPLPPSPSEDANSGFEKSDSGVDSKVQNSYLDNKTHVYNETSVYNQTPVYNEYSSPSASAYVTSTPSQDSNQAWPGNYPNGSVPDSNAHPPPDDEEDRMSLDSNDSGGGNASIEINPQAMKPEAPVALMSIPTNFNKNMQQPPWPQSSANNFNMGSFVNTQNASINNFTNYMSGGFNQNFINQFNNELNNEESIEDGEGQEKQEITFSSVLEDFVQELKEILTKDLCKKMVENSGFKSYERWWDREEEKTKVIGKTWQSNKVHFADMNAQTSLFF